MTCPRYATPSRRGGTFYDCVCLDDYTRKNDSVLDSANFGCAVTDKCNLCAGNARSDCFVPTIDKGVAEGGLDDECVCKRYKGFQAGTADGLFWAKIWILPARQTAKLFPTVCEVRLCSLLSLTEDFNSIIFDDRLSLEVSTGQWAQAFFETEFGSCQFFCSKADAHDKLINSVPSVYS